MANRFMAAASLPLSLSNNLGCVLETKMLVKKHISKPLL
jgi:hypothetical protein